MKLIKNYKIREIAGEKVIVMQGSFGSDMTKVITLNESSEYLLNSLYDKDFVLEDVVNFLIEKYDVDKETAEKDSSDWAEKLIGCGLIIK